MDAGKCGGRGGRTAEAESIWPTSAGMGRQGRGRRRRHRRRRQRGRGAEGGERGGAQLRHFAHSATLPVIDTLCIAVPRSPSRPLLLPCRCGCCRLQHAPKPEAEGRRHPAASSFDGLCVWGAGRALSAEQDAQRQWPRRKPPGAKAASGRSPPLRRGGPSFLGHASAADRTVPAYLPANQPASPGDTPAAHAAYALAEATPTPASPFALPPPLWRAHPTGRPGPARPLIGSARLGEEPRGSAGRGTRPSRICVQYLLLRCARRLLGPAWRCASCRQVTTLRICAGSGWQAAP